MTAAPDHLWSSRFTAGLDEEALEYTHTTDIDTRLVGADLWGTIAHVVMLQEAEIVSAPDAALILGSLLALEEDYRRGRFHLRRELEDVHLNIEQAVRDAVGPVGGRMHTARSRNDQVVTATRIHLRDALADIAAELLRLIELLVARAEASADDLFLAYTHSQPAQPVTLGFWFSGFASMFARDLERLDDTYRRLDRSPLGTCAVAGTSFPIDRERTADLMGFAAVEEHALDATSARDLMIECASVLAMAMSTVSRISEELVIWSMQEVGLVAIDDRFATGSSIMPQKRNPVVAELGRARAGAVVGCLIELHGAVGRVPSGYSCDLQQDKPPLWRALDITRSSLSMLTAELATARFDVDRAAAIRDGGFVVATELANMLVRSHGLPFREAYVVVGAVVRELDEQGATLADTDLVVEALARSGISLGADTVAEGLDPGRIVSSYTSRGGTAPSSVRASCAHLAATAETHRQRWATRRDHVADARSMALRTARSLADGGAS